METFYKSKATTAKKEKRRRSFKEAPFSRVHASIYWAVVLGQIACAYSLGIAGTAFSEAQQSLHFSDTWLGLLGAGSLIGLAGSFVMGRLADKIGRKQLLMGNMYLFTLFAAAQLVVTNPLGLSLLRIAIGLMMAIDYTVGNTLLIEWLPTAHGAKKQSNLLLYWAYGFALAFVAGYVITDWRLALASGGIFSFVTALYRTFVKIPPSPAWLAAHGRPKAAQKVITKRLGAAWRLPASLSKLKKSAVPAATALFNRHNWRATLVGSAFYATQAFAFFGIGIFLPILLASFGVKNSLISGTLYNVAIILGTALGIIVFNRLPRRWFINLTYIIATACLFAMACLGQQINSTILLSIFVLFSVVLSMSLLLDYPYTTELFSLKIRATGVGFVITMSRIGAAAGTFLLPVIVNRWGAYVTMAVCGSVLLVGTLVCLLLAPETNPDYK